MSNKEDHKFTTTSDPSETSNSITQKLNLKHTPPTVVHTNEDLASENDS
jgi:hypothetical protein